MKFLDKLGMHKIYVLNVLILLDFYLHTSTNLRISAGGMLGCYRLLYINRELSSLSLSFSQILSFELALEPINWTIVRHFRTYALLHPSLYNMNRGTLCFCVRGLLHLLITTLSLKTRLVVNPLPVSRRNSLPTG